MYKAFFGLTESPFSISPNPKYLYMSERHTEALTHLNYGLREGGGFVLLTGEVGTGKTTVSRSLRQQLPENTDLALVLNPTLTERELLAATCDEFGVSYPAQAGLKELGDALRAYLIANHASGRRSLLLIDEAQHLSAEVLEQLRLLTNLETDDAKLLQVVLIGQPELQALLRQPLLRQLAQRITARYHLLPLSREDVDAYVRFRLQVAGCVQPIFTAAAIRALHRLSGGIPRLINLIAERALLGAFAANAHRIDDKLVVKAAYDALGVEDRGTSGWGMLAYTFCGLLMLVAGWFGWQHWGWFPSPKITRIEVPVTLPPDAKVMKRFETALAQASYQDEAMLTLFRIWGFEPSLDEANCDNASRVGLLCQQGTGKLEELQALDHPAVVRLFDENASEFYADLLRLDDKSADLLIDGETWTVTRAWLEQAWGDEYTLLWRLPKSGSRSITPRSGKADVQWLENALSRAFKERPRKISKFDSQLADKLKRFQQAEGLKPDGVAGTQTLIRLNARSREPMPRLDRPAEVAVQDEDETAVERSAS
ncbi:ExeA family protein [Pseudaeromonas sharmana]|uniref:ExeA family protein n=1 Tax=Pseudaeromonas sharmana TaxID=328412 RepID=A0ABV8CS30_9GAMM